MAGLRRSEAAGLEWRDVTDARGDDGLLIAVRRSKTNPDSETADVRFVKGDVASAVRALREWHGDFDPADRVVGLSAQAISERFAAAARAAGIDARLTAHSGPRRAGQRADRARGLGARRDARRQLEDRAHGGPLLGRRERRAWGRRALPVRPEAA